jgi:predicted ATP-dependent Lon-type protease
MIFIWIAISLLFVWLVLVTIFFVNLYSHYNHLFKGSTQRTLQGLLENLIKDNEISKKDIEKVSERCATIEKDGLEHIQKVGLLRFNPFNDTGGDQSFILALTDATDTGVVISGLYSRSGTRWYAKQVKHGKGVEHELSDYERKALQGAKVIEKKK